MSHVPSRCVMILLAAAMAALGIAACNAIAGMDGLAFDLATAVGGSGQAGASAGGGSTGGGSAGSGLVFTDDELDGEFGAGQFSDTAWNGDHLGLAAGVLGGTFQSRVFDAERTVAWSSIEWEPGGPYAKPLPDAAAAETGYRNGGVDMASNLLLWHFEGSLGALIDGAVLVDSSPDGYDGIVSDHAALVDGLFGLAVDDDLTGYVYTPMVANGDLQFGTSDFSWSLWVNTSHECPPDNPPSGNRVYMGADESGGDGTHLWFGCTSSTSTCPNPDGTGRAGGTFCSHTTPSSDCEGFCGQTVINDGEWHHLALVKEGHTSGTLTLYVDGSTDFSGSPSVAFAFEVPIVFPDDNEFTIGAFTEGTYQAMGIFDEVAVWKRALSAAEMAAVHARGALRMALQVRVCQQPDCSDDPPFVGPSGAQSFYTDPVGALAPPTPIALEGLAPGRYFQYRAELASRQLGLEPELYSVTVRATE